ncbi:tripartite tricarboxylate transporter substrate binding protein [Opitutales bacterium]|nr:tripartite tricarboxylate transporter substrate binding protein [Opitutales bacterium]
MKRLLLLSLFLLPLVHGAFPEKPIKFIVPTNAGGGIDAQARILQRAIGDHKLLPEKVVVVNIPGGGGVVGTGKVKSAKPDGYTIGLWNAGLVTSRVMGISKFDHTDFEIIGMTGYTELGLAVKNDSSIKTVSDLVQRANVKPGTLKFSTDIGTPVHFIPLMFADEADIEFRFVQTGGGSKRLASIMGGHTEVSLFSTLAMLTFSEAGLRPLLVFSEDRNELLPNVMTSKEGGVNVVLTEPRFWIAPKGTPEDRLTILRGALTKAMALPAVHEDFASQGIAPVFADADQVTQELDTLLEKIGPIIKR